MGKYDSTIKYAEEQIKRMKDQFALYKKFKNPGWEGAVKALTRQINCKLASTAYIKNARYVLAYSN